MPKERMLELANVNWSIALIDFTASKINEHLIVDPRYSQAKEHLFEARRLLMVTGQDISASIAFFNEGKGNPEGHDDGASKPDGSAAET